MATPLKSVPKPLANESIFRQFADVQSASQALANHIQGLTVHTDQWFQTLTPEEPQESEFDEVLLDSPLDSLTLDELNCLYPGAPDYSNTIAIAKTMDVHIPGYTMSVLAAMPGRVAPAASTPIFYVGALLRVLIAIARAIGGTVGRLMLRLLGVGRPITKILEARRALQAARGLQGVPEWAKQIFIRYAVKNYRAVLIKQIAILTAELAVIAVTLKQLRDQQVEAEETKRRAEELDERIRRRLEDPQTDPEVHRELEEIKEQNGEILDELNNQLNNLNNRIREMERDQENKQRELEENENSLAEEPEPEDE